MDTTSGMGLCVTCSRWGGGREGGRGRENSSRLARSRKQSSRSGRGRGLEWYSEWVWGLVSCLALVYTRSLVLPCCLPIPSPMPNPEGSGEAHLGGELRQPWFASQQQPGCCISGSGTREWEQVLESRWLSSTGGTV